MAIELGRSYVKGKATSTAMLKAMQTTKVVQQPLLKMTDKIRGATWNTWKDDPRQRPKPYPTREETEGLPRDMEWWRNHSKRLDQVARAAV